jgi:hypothetical protein
METQTSTLDERPPVKAGGYVPPRQLLRRQPDPDNGCGLYAPQNLYVWAQREPVPVELMEAYLTGQGYDLSNGANAVMAFSLLLDDPGHSWRCALSFVPSGLGAREVFAPFLDAGCALLVSFIWRDGARHFGHACVAVDYSDDGLLILDSGGSGGHGKTIAFSYEAAPEGASVGDAPDDALPHGRVLRLPWVTMPFDEWRELGTFFRNGQSEPAPLGISREFLIVWPG